MINKLKNYIYFAMYLLVNPKIILKIFKGVYLPVYIQHQWLKDYHINTIIDVGTYKGEDARVFHDLFPEAKIYAFEPMKFCNGYIKKNIKTSNLVIINKALSNKRGFGDFYIYKHKQASSLKKFTKKYNLIYDLETTTKVETTTLDDYFSGKKVDKKVILKIDAQGEEWKILGGAKKFIRGVEIVIVETAFEKQYQGQKLFNNIYVFMVDNGFGFWGYMPDGEFYPNFSLTKRTNSIFIKRK